MNDRDAIDVLEKMVRAGFRPKNFSPQGDVEEEIKRLSSSLLGKHGLGEADALRVQTLVAQHHTQNGRFTKALDLLMPWWQETGAVLRSRGTDKDVSHNLLRAQVWASMQYILLAFLATDKQPAVALDHLGRIENLVVSLSSPDTLAAFHYFSGLACGQNRDFNRAEDHLLTAQEQVFRHFDEQLKRKSPGDVSYDITYRDSFCARILAALSSLAIKRGRVRRAQHLVRMAQTLLLGTELRAWSLYVESLLWIAKRRHADLASDAYQAAMAALEKCAIEFDKRQDNNGRGRCLSEVVRGHLDRVEFGKLTPDEKRRSLDEADKRLKILAELPLQKPRHAIHSIRYLLLADRADDITNARLEETRASSSGRESPLLEIALLRHQKRHFDDVGEVLHSLLRRSTTNRHHPLLEAECYIALASLCLEVGNRRDDARKYLNMWKPLSDHIENRYLHVAADAIRQGVDGRSFPYDFELYKEMPDGGRVLTQTLSGHLEEFERWLLMTVQERGLANTLDQLAEVYGQGKDRFGMRRRFELLGLPLPAESRRLRKQALTKVGTMDDAGGRSRRGARGPAGRIADDKVG